MPDFKILVGAELESNAINTLRSQLSGIKDVVLKVDKIEISSAALNSIRSQLSRSGPEMASVGTELGNQISAGISRATRNIKINVNSSEIDKLRSALSLKGVDTQTIGDITNRLSNLDVQIKKISTSFKSVNGKNFLSQINISAINQLGNAVEVIDKYNKKTGELTSTNTRVSTSFDQVASAAEKAAERERVAAEKAANATEKAAAKKQASIQSQIQSAIDTNSFAASFAGIDAQLKRVGESSQYLDQSFQNTLRTLDGFRGFNWDETLKGNPEQAAAAWNSYNTSLNNVRNTLTAAVREQSAMVGQIERMKVSSGMQAWLSQNSAANRQFGDQIRNIITQLETADRVEFNNLRQQFATIQNQARATGAVGRSFADEMKNMFSKFSSWFSVATIVMRGIRGIKQMVSDVHAIDTALTDLYKVTDNTSTQYAQFFKEASANAKEYGSTIRDMIASTADFARLGYSLQEASSLASVANIYKNVGDISVEDGTKSIISTMKAFKFEAEDAIVIVDKFNEVGNNFAISSAGIGDSLQRSASSLAAAGNDINQAIGMITAANTVVQDPESVGTALKTISMRIRGAATELEEAGLDTEGMVTSVSKLREEILALSGVDILIDADTFKSTYDILDELSVKWKDLTDIQRANNRCLYVQKCA